VAIRLIVLLYIEFHNLQTECICHVGCRSSTVQLLSRHWKVKNAQGKLVAEVSKGTRGVVGCTPILKPGTCFCYYSGTDMDSQGGSMAGSFGMATLDSKGAAVDSFDATIASFRFITVNKG